MEMDRRTVLKGSGAAAGASLFATTGAAAGTNVDGIDTDSDDLQGALVVFDPDAGFGVLDGFDLPEGRHEMPYVDMVYTRAAGSTLAEIASLPGVRSVQANEDLEYHNQDERIATNAGTVQDRYDLGYTGDGVHVAVIDSGIDAYHPDLQDRLKHNYQYTDPLNSDTMWVDVGIADTDSIGHGSHCSGTICGEGNQKAKHKGMAPDADLTVYAAGAGLSILQAVGAYNHLLANHAPDTAPSDDEIIRVTSNSYGATGGSDFNPAGASELATWKAFEADITVVGSAGNSGPGTNTLGAAKTAPYILCVAASHDGQGSGLDATLRPTDFSSRGRPDDNHDRAEALGNVRDFHTASGTRPTTAGPRSSTYTVGPGTDAGGLAGAPGVGSSTYVEITPEDADTVFLDIEVTWTGGQQDLDLYLYEGDTADAKSSDSPIASSTSGSPGERIQTGGIDSAKTYTLEINPWANVATQATVTVTEKGESTGTEVSGPFGLYRPSVIAPGKGVISTMGASALKAASPTYGGSPQETGAFYAALSGTSMSCPVTSGVVCQLIEAYYRNHGGEYPSPEQVIALVEAGADPNVEKDYTPYNAGAGLVNALQTVEAAEQPKAELPDIGDATLASDDTLEFLSASGTRSDDGRVFTGGQTDQVTIEFTSLSHDISAAEEAMPEGWTVVAAGDGVTVHDDGKRVTFAAGEINAAIDAGETAEFTYFVEAPSGPQQTSAVSFGPVMVESDETDDDAPVAVSGTSSTELLVGPSTNA